LGQRRQAGYAEPILSGLDLPPPPAFTGGNPHQHAWHGLPTLETVKDL